MIKDANHDDSTGHGYMSNQLDNVPTMEELVAAAGPNIEQLGQMQGLFKSAELTGIGVTYNKNFLWLILVVFLYSTMT